MSRYRLRARHRPSPLYLKAEILRVRAHTAYLEIATDGNARIQCRTRLRIQNTRGSWRKVHRQDTLPVEIGPPLSLPLCPVASY